MLTSELAIAAYRAGRVVPDRLTRRAHAHYLAYARQMLAVYRTGIGRTRRALHRDIENLFAAEPDCPTRRIHAFCKLLDEAGTFRADRRGQAARLRLRVFTLAAAHHPLVRERDRLFDSLEVEVKARIAQDLGRPWDDIEAALYADVLDFQALDAFAGCTDPADLLSRYNVAQLQAALYRCERMVVTATRDFVPILRYAKLVGLLVETARAGPEAYRITLSGPATVLRATRRYGVLFARFLPALLACRGWRLEALIRTPWNTRADLVLTDRDGFTSHFPAPAEFDSGIEAEFARAFGAERDGWRLLRAAEVLQQGQLVFVPDFVFRRDDGAEVLFEIVGFWTLEYLAKKREVLSRFRDRRVLLAVAERSLRPGAAVPPDVLVYKSNLKAAPVLEALVRLHPPRSPREPQAAAP
jgi:predicted nuclease of restriction endonuclease-like RecB superfamily